MNGDCSQDLASLLRRFVWLLTTYDTVRVDPVLVFLDRMARDEYTAKVIPACKAYWDAYSMEKARRMGVVPLNAVKIEGDTQVRQPSSCFMRTWKVYPRK